MKIDPSRARIDFESQGGVVGFDAPIGEVVTTAKYVVVRTEVIELPSPPENVLVFDVNGIEKYRLCPPASTLPGDYFVSLKHADGERVWLHSFACIRFLFDLDERRFLTSEFVH